MAAPPSGLMRLGVGGAIEPLHQDRRHQPGDQERRHQGYGHRQRQRLEEGARHAGKEGQRQEDQDRRGGRPQQGTEELHGRRAQGADAVFARLVQAALHMLDHDDGVVDDQADGGGHAAQGHDIEALAKHLQGQGGQGQDRRHDHDRHQRHADVAQEHQQHQRRQHRADGDGFGQALRRGVDQLALVVPGRDLDARRRRAPRIGEHLGDRLDDANGVAAGLLIDLDQHRVVAIGGDPHELRRAGQSHAGDVADAHDGPAGALDHHLLNIGGAGQAAVGKGQIELAAIFQLARRL